MLASGAWLASGSPSIGRANFKASVVAFIDIEAPGARGACEKYRLALAARFPNPDVRPEVVFVPSVVLGTDENAEELKRTLENLRPAIILAANPFFARVAREFKLGLPILFFAPDEVVANNFTGSLIRPSAGMTGFTFGATSTLKRREMLLRLAPDCKVLGILGNASDRGEGIGGAPVSVADSVGKVEKRYFSCLSVDELVTLLRRPDARSVDAWDVPYSQVPFRYAEETVREFARTRRPVMYARVRHVRLGGMAAYEPNLDEAFNAWAAQTASLLDGVPIADIPVVQSTRYNFGLNLTACRKVGVDPPKSLLKIADVVIQ